MTREEAEAVLAQAGQGADEAFPLLDCAIACAIHDYPFRDADGVRILADMAYEMQRRGVNFGLETMCIGGGQGMAAIFERAA